MYRIQLLLILFFALTALSYSESAKGAEQALANYKYIQSTKIRNIKQDVIQQLKQCETSLMTEDDAPIIFDTNKKASIGLFQFQITTVIMYYKKFYGRELTKKEAVILALDESRSSELVEHILFETEKGYENWLNCSRKNDLVGQIKVIKRLD